MDKGLTIHNYYKLRPVNVLQGIIYQKFIQHKNL